MHQILVCGSMESAMHGSWDAVNPTGALVDDIWSDARIHSSRSGKAATHGHHATVRVFFEVLRHQDGSADVRFVVRPFRCSSVEHKNLTSRIEAEKVPNAITLDNVSGCSMYTFLRWKSAD